MQDKRKIRPSRRAPPEEVESLERLYQTQYRGWNVQHFYEHYVAEHGGQRSYTWVNDRLKASGLLAMKPKRNGDQSAGRSSSTNAGKISAPTSSDTVEGSRLDQCALTYEWVPPHRWSLVATLDSGTADVYAGFFVDRVDIWSAFRGVQEVVEAYGLFGELREGHAFFGRTSQFANAESTPLGQFRRAMEDLGIDSVVDRSRRTRGRLARFGRTIRGRLPNELARAGVTEKAEADAFLRRYWSRFNERFAAPSREERKAAFDPLFDSTKNELPNVFCLKHSLQTDGEGYLQYQGRHLRIDGRRLRGDSGDKPRLHEYRDGSLALYQGRHLVDRIDAGFADGTDQPSCAAFPGGS